MSLIDEKWRLEGVVVYSGWILAESSTLSEPKRIALVPEEEVARYIVTMHNTLIEINEHKA